MKDYSTFPNDLKTYLQLNIVNFAAKAIEENG
jgi:hypothetical protein